MSNTGALSVEEEHSIIAMEAIGIYTFVLYGEQL